MKNYLTSNLLEKNLYCIIFSLFILSISNIHASNTNLQEIDISYFSKKLKIEYDLSMFQKNKFCTSQTCIEKFHNSIEESDYNILLNNLLQYKEQLELNDWFFYMLVHKTVDQICTKKSSMYKTNIIWFFITKAGYDTRLYTAQNKFSFLYVNTTDDVYEMPYVKIDGNFYLNVTSIYYKLRTKGLLMELQKFQPGALNKKTFSLKIKNYPNIPPMVVDKEFNFTHNQKEITLRVKVDTVTNQLLSNYPFIKAINYIETPFTETTRKSILKAINPHIKSLELEDQLSFFVSFSRKAFQYEGDYKLYSRDKPLTAEQTLISEYSDFEDRVALMYNLLKEATDLNFVLVQYVFDDIITVGVQLPDVYGKPFINQGVNYTICDPTMPNNTGKLGIYPINFNKDYEILEEVNQKIEVGMKD